MIAAEAPATIANMGPGFDTLGFALAEPRVRVTLTRGDEKKRRVRITVDQSLPTDPAKNTAGAALLALMSQHKIDDDIEMDIHAGIPIGSGLGSSAASAVATVIAANALFDLGLTAQQLLPFAVSGEGATSGSAHADNVAPALLGGITLVRSHEPLDVLQIPIPHDLCYVVVHPACVVETAAARRALPKNIALQDAVRQWAQVGALVAALHQHDFSLLGRAMDDTLIEPIRGALIPGYSAVKHAALQAGAIGCAIAGSGPSMFAFVASQQSAQQVGQAMQRAFADAGMQSTLWSGAISARGAHVVSP